MTSRQPPCKGRCQILRNDNVPEDKEARTDTCKSPLPTPEGDFLIGGVT